MRGLRLLILIGAAGLLLTSPVQAQIDVQRDVPCCDTRDTRAVVWAGSRTTMTAQEVASYCAPVLWFSPDEPLLRYADEDSIQIPTNFPFEPGSGGRPVVYYRIRTVVTRHGGAAYEEVPGDRGASVIDLDRVSALDIDYFFYYPSEEGLGGHTHDVESVELKVGVFRQPDCKECRHGLAVLNANGKAHGVLWYDNTLETDIDTRVPIHVLVEEGKHASCTDKNADGYFTPGYDVNKRVNDAWGVRDVISTGSLFAGGFQSWFAKVRRPEHRVFPPLPQDSFAREPWTEDGVYGEGQPIYELRPYPKVQAAIDWGEDPGIMRFVEKGYDDWPETAEDTDLRALGDWLDEESFVKSLSIAVRRDNHWGVSFVFPLFIFKSFNDPVGGGWLVNRIYLKDKDLRDFSWNLLYSPSASRWIDGYFALGFERDREDGGYDITYFMTETGLKFRANVAHSGVPLIGGITDFWGFRVGLRYIGFGTINELGWAVEIGAGSF